MTSPAPLPLTRLSPRRRLYAQRVLSWLNADVARWHTGVIPFKANTYVSCSQATKLHWLVIDIALDDLFWLQKVDVELSDAGEQLVRPLAGEVE